MIYDDTYDQTKNTVTYKRSFINRAGKEVTGNVQYKKYQSPVTNQVKRFFNKVDKLHENLKTLGRNNGLLHDEFIPIMEHNFKLFHEQNKKALI